MYFMCHLLSSYLKNSRTKKETSVGFESKDLEGYVNSDLVSYFVGSFLDLVCENKALLVLFCSSQGEVFFQCRC